MIGYTNARQSPKAQIVDKIISAVGGFMVSGGMAKAPEDIFNYVLTFPTIIDNAINVSITELSENIHYVRIELDEKYYVEFKIWKASKA